MRLAYFSMKIAIVSCFKYRDCWNPAFILLKKFWPSGFQSAILVTDRYESGWCDAPNVFVYDDKNWCPIVKEFTETMDAPFCMLQEDFLLTSPVREDLVEHGLKLISGVNAGCVRLYPCPGADQDWGDPNFGIVSFGQRFRISCQAAIWTPYFLRRLLVQFKTPQQFEWKGTQLAEQHFSDRVVAFKRNVQPWPLEYICTGIVKGKWTRAALALCKEYGIEVDTSLRPIEP